MPIRDGKRYCVTHTKTRMTRTDRLKALTNVTGSVTDGKLDPNASIDTTAALIVMPFFCEECGYLELYVADRARFDKGDDK
jgi:hypothetical protein